MTHVRAMTRTLPPPAGRARLLRLPLPAMVAAYCLLWASAFSVAKVTVTDCPPLLALTARFLLAAGIVLGTSALSVTFNGTPFKLSRRDGLVFAMLGIANQAVYLSLSYAGMRTISSGLMAMIVSANPVLTAVLAALLLGDRMTWRKASGLLLGAGGVALVVQGRLAGGVEDPKGIALALAALVSLVGGTILYKRLAPTGDLWLGNGVQSLVAGLAMLPFAFASERVADIVPSWRLLASLVYSGLLVSVFAYLLWFHLLDVSGATAASSYHFLMPPLGMLFGWLLLGEGVAPADLVGIVPVALGIYLVTRPARLQRRV
jgi:drug/metabolite transporter (DMT)-like permease